MIGVDAAMTSHAHGATAYLYPERTDPDDLSSAWIWTGYIDRADGTPGGEPGLAAHAPQFGTDQEAIAWALRHTGRVVIYDHDNVPYWAGSDPALEDLSALWSERAYAPHSYPAGRARCGEPSSARVGAEPGLILGVWERSEWVGGVRASAGARATNSLTGQALLAVCHRRRIASSSGSPDQSAASG
ncbi:hypothetical protein OIE66_18475 [Nonomuraea sp. NBC_01738]|uniref:hypothetical protein n=1 Tax=Nonomuraea sp. NBC_01738 TaxID=2976003 RepID=UPI002E11DDD9|nr:hypothetical protein OIE66_18475 [Nonomuraea sp. NBC_01738]